jgi:hypothetical protein
LFLTGRRLNFEVSLTVKFLVMKALFHFLPWFVALMCCWSPLPAQETAKPYISTSGAGPGGQGAGVTLVRLDGNDRPEIIAMAYDSSAGRTTYKYKIGYNVDANGQPERWSAPLSVLGGSNFAQGAGLGVADLDANPRPDMILMAYNAPDRVNDFRYQVGKNLNAQGVADQWGPVLCIPGVGDEAGGAALALYDLDQSGRPDLILMAYDGDGEFRFRVGKNLDANGRTRSWSGMTIVDGVGLPAEGAGIAIADLNANGLPDMVLMAYVNKTFRYKIGYDLDADGYTANWAAIQENPGVGGPSEGADVAIFDLNGDGAPETVFLAYRAVGGANEFRFKVLDLAPVK